jgi:hypothetical protein
MDIEKEITSIRSGIKAGRFSNEAAVCQGIVPRLLNALGWPAYDTDAVWPEYSLGNRRVDYALCSPPGKPIAFIEVKQLGQSDGAERQLFEYAFHIGVPMAILTDGQEWNFFLPGEQGDYGERRVYKLDIAERDIGECVDRLERYLLHSAVASGTAIQAARDDYRNVSKDRQMHAALPKAWSHLVADEDGMLLEIVADKVESLCGFKPDPDVVAGFLKKFVSGRAEPALQPRNAQNAARLTEPTRPNAAAQRVVAAQVPREPAVSHQIGFAFEGQFYACRNAIDTLKQIFDLLIKRDPTFAERFAGLPKHGRTRRYLAKTANDLYYERPDLVSEFSEWLDAGWWMSTNHSKQTIGKIIEMACDVAQIGFGRDLIAHLGV